MVRAPAWHDRDMSAMPQDSYTKLTDALWVEVPVVWIQLYVACPVRNDMFAARTIACRPRRSGTWRPFGVQRPDRDERRRDGQHGNR